MAKKIDCTLSEKRPIASASASDSDDRRDEPEGRARVQLAPSA